MHRTVWLVNLLCDAISASRGGFYACLVRPSSRRSLDDEKLSARVRQSFVRSDLSYGTRRLWRDVLQHGQLCGLHRMERLMCEQPLRARPGRPSLPKAGSERCAVADNVLDRQFGRSTYPELGGRLYLHLNSRRLAVRGSGA